MNDNMMLKRYQACVYLRTRGLRGRDSSGKSINPPYVSAVQTNIRVTIERARNHG